MPYLCVGGPLHGHTVAADQSVQAFTFDNFAYQAATIALLGRAIPVLVDSSIASASPQDSAEHGKLMNALAEAILQPTALGAWQASASDINAPANGANGSATFSEPIAASSSEE